VTRLRCKRRVNIDSTLDKQSEMTSAEASVFRLPKGYRLGTGLSANNDGMGLRGVPWRARYVSHAHIPAELTQASCRR
jgi:hypothetical protein